MGYLKVEYNQKHKQMVYNIWFNPSTFGVEESSTYTDNFEGCLRFILNEFSTRAKLLPIMQKFSFETKGNIPQQQKQILEEIVKLYNRSPQLYAAIADRKSYQSLGECFGHIKPKKR
jgi:hypothetical protein